MQSIQDFQNQSNINFLVHLKEVLKSIKYRRKEQTIFALSEIGIRCGFENDLGKDLDDFCNLYLVFSKI